MGFRAFSVIESAIGADLRSLYYHRAGNQGEEEEALATESWTLGLSAILIAQPRLIQIRIKETFHMKESDFFQLLWHNNTIFILLLYQVEFNQISNHFNRISFRGNYQFWVRNE